MATKPRKTTVFRTWPSDFLSASRSSAATVRTAETFMETRLAAPFAPLGAEVGAALGSAAGAGTRAVSALF